MTIESLVQRAADGDREAFAALAAPRVDRLFATATLILRDRGRAEDAVQDALVRAWRDIRTLRDPHRLDAWLRRLLVNACYDESRRHRRHAANVTLLPEHEPPTPDVSAEIADRDEMEAALGRLSTDHRAVVIHYYYLGLSLPEIADALDIPVGTTKSRLYHARSALRKGLMGSEGDNHSEGNVA